MMTKEEKPIQVADGIIVTMDYVLTVDGEEIDSSKEEGPLAYLQGADNIIPGLERELEGMKIGESKKVTVAPEDGYGEIDPEGITEVSIDEFPEEIPLEPGVELELTDTDGEEMFATIIEVSEDTVTLDTNHPLAGKTLHFEVTIVDLRHASNEEIAHGHAHFGNGH
jgi:FKBP-type peptidyl-prolyl cis-trans isomerase SlyD